MTNNFRRVVAGSLAAAVLIGAGAGAASASVLEGLEFQPGTWGDTGTSEAFPGGGSLTELPGFGGTWEDPLTPEEAQAEADRAAAEEQEPLPGPPDRLAEESQLGQVADAAETAAKAQAQAAKTAAEHPEVGAEAAKAAANAGAKVAELARQAAAQAAQEAAQPAEPTNLGAAGPATVSVAGPTVDLDLLSVTYEEVVGNFERKNTAAEAAWEWLKIHGWRGIPGDGAEKLYAPSHPRYGETVFVGELEETWCYPILPGSDVTEHVAEILKAAGWYEADLWEPGGAPWLLPPEALTN